MHRLTAAAGEKRKGDEVPLRSLKRTRPGGARPGKVRKKKKKKRRRLTEGKHPQTEDGRRGASLHSVPGAASHWKGKKGGSRE